MNVIPDSGFQVRKKELICGEHDDEGRVPRGGGASDCDGGGEQRDDREHRLHDADARVEGGISQPERRCGEAMRLGGEQQIKMDYFSKDFLRVHTPQYLQPSPQYNTVWG